MTLVSVTDVYGRRCRIAQEDLDNPDKTQLLIYTRDGRKRSQLANPLKTGAVTIHRDNIEPRKEPQP